jgi:anti-anti-sigma factor
MEDDGLQIEVSLVDAMVVMTVGGELDAVSAPRLEMSLEQLDLAGRVVLETSGVEFIDSTGLRVILDRAMRMCTAGGALRIRTASPPLHRLLHLTKLDGLLERHAAA